MPAETYVSGEELITELQKRFFLREVNLIEEAYKFAQGHYGSLIHPTGKTYLEYVLGVAATLADIDAHPLVIAASIVNPPLPEHEVVLADLKQDFPNQEDLIKLVEENFLLSKLEWNVWSMHSATNKIRERKEILLKMFLIANDDNKSEEQEELAAPHFQKREKQIENIVRMFLAEVTDIRVLLINLADRLHCMKLLKNLEDKQK